MIKAGKIIQLHNHFLPKGLYSGNGSHMRSSGILIDWREDNLNKRLTEGEQKLGYAQLLSKFKPNYRENLSNVT
jgi:hypothetical protein